MEEQLPINQSIPLYVPRSTSHDSHFWFLKAESDSGQDIGDDADEDHLNVG